MHIYLYGSTCRGEVEPRSDIDLLAAVDGPDARFDPMVYSIYPYDRLEELWTEGNPFAWHLFMESRLVFAEDGVDFVRELGEPRPYMRWPEDSKKFHHLFVVAADVLAVRRDSAVFELATMFLAIRNVAICYSLISGASPVFSRRAFENIGPDSLTLDSRSRNVLDDARILSTRGVGARPSASDVGHVLSHVPEIHRWMRGLMAKVSVQ